MARNPNIDRLIDMLPKGESIRYGARGDADAGARANLDALMGEGQSILEMEEGRNARQARLAAIRARRGTDMAAQAAPQAAPSSAATRGTALARVPAAQVPASQVQYIPPTQSSGRVFQMPAAGGAAQRGPIPMGGIPQQAIGQGMGGGMPAVPGAPGGMVPGAMNMADDAALALARQAGPTALGPISYSGNYGATAQTLGQLGAPARQLGQAAAASADDVVRALGAAGTPRVAATRAAVNVIPSSGASIPMGGAGMPGAARAASSSADDLLRGIGSSADDVARTATLRNLAGQATNVAGNMAPLADDVAGAASTAAGRAGMMGRLGAAARLIGPPSLGYMGGQMVGGLVDSANIGGDNSAQDRFWRNAAVGAGLGAGIGTIVPGVGNVVGGLVGGAIGGVGMGLLGMKYGDDDTVETVGGRLSQALARTGLDPNTQQAVLAQFALQTQGKGASEARLVADALGQQASQLILGQEQQRAQQERAMALQSMMAPLFTPYLDMAASSARANTLALNNAANTLTDPDMAAIYRARAANLENMAMQGVAGYAAQMQNPQMARDLALLGQYGSRVDSSILGTLAGQTAQGALGTGQGGQMSFADILANAQRVAP